MTEQEQNIAIAEACGWTDCHIHKQEGLYDTCYGLRNVYQSCHETLPYYTSDLNAMQEAILDQELEIQMKIAASLISATSENGCEMISGFLGVMNATVAQRAEAFLRTLNLWKES